MALSAFASHTQFERESGVYNVKADGAVGDGDIDDTVAIQTTLNRFSDGVTATGSGRIYVPAGGIYKISAPLIYGGGVSHGLHIEGGLGGSRGPSGAQFAWYGSAGKTMFIVNGANGFSMENLEFNGRDIARRGVHFTATQIVNTTLGTVVTPGAVEVTPAAMTNIAVGTLLNVDSGANLEYVYVTAITGSTFTALFVKSHGTSAVVGNGHSSSGIVLRRLTVVGCVGAGSAALAFGNVTAGSTPQISEVDMYDLHLQGDSSTSEAGILTLSTGNTKNYKLHGGGIAYFKYGLDMIASGTLLVDGTIFALNSVADLRVGIGNTHLQSVESESSKMFVTGTTGANPGSLTIVNSQWIGITAADDLAITYPGNITLLGNLFYNDRTGSSVPKIRSSGVFTDTTVATILSQGNFFENAPAGFIPVENATPADVFTLGKELLSITSLGDYGGVSGALIKLTNFIPKTYIGGLPLSGVQGASVADATDAATAITQLNALISRLEALGLIATV